MNATGGIDQLNEHAMNTNARGSARDPVSIPIYVGTTVLIAGLLMAAAAPRSWAQEASPAGPDTVRVDTAVVDSASVDSVAIDSAAVDSAAATGGGDARPTSSVVDTLSRDVLERAVRAYAAVGRIRGTYRDRYGAAAASAEADTTYGAFRRDAERAIRDAGLAVPTYRSLLRSANEDSLLRRVLTMAVRAGPDSLTVAPDSLLLEAGPEGAGAEIDSTATPSSEAGAAPEPSDSTNPSPPIEP